MLSLYYNDLKWMKYISWETKFMLVVVLLPLFIGLTTVLLVKSITEILWLSLLVTSLLSNPHRDRACTPTHTGCTPTYL